MTLFQEKIITTLTNGKMIEYLRITDEKNRLVRYIVNREY